MLSARLQAWLRVGCGVALTLVFLAHAADWWPLRFLQQLELWAYDARLRAFVPNTLDERVAIVDIDEKSLAAEGRWPWSRDKVAALVRQLFDRYHVATLGFDIAFPESDNSTGVESLERLSRFKVAGEPQFRALLDEARRSLDYDRVLAEEIGRHPVVLGFFLGGQSAKAGVLPESTFTDAALVGDRGWQLQPHVASGYSANLPELQRRAAAAGHLYPALDIDGVTRRMPMLMKFGDGYYEALPLAVMRTYLGNAPARVRVTPPSVGNVAVVAALQVGPLRIPLDDRMAALIPYRGRSGVFRYVSATDVLHGALPPEALRGKIVLVGTSAQGLLDMRATPVREDLPGVEVHASLISGFLDGRIPYRPDFSRGLSVSLVALVGLGLAFLLPRLSAAAATGAVVLVLAALVGGNAYAWSAHRFALDVAAPLSLVLLLYLLNAAWGFFAEARSRRMISALFGTYVPPPLVAEMSKNPDAYSMRGETRDMTVLFSDVRDFTSISEGLSAEELRRLMNAYLSEMTAVIQETGGTIDKYIGDAIMAFWGAPLSDPEHAAHGVRAALAMQRRIRRLDEPFVARGWPPLAIGVGLNSGEMNVGDMGSSFRRAYTVLGDRVNIASRIEALTKEYGVGILVGEDVVKAAPGFVYREVDRVVVKGRQQALAIYEPLGSEGEVGAAALAELERFREALTAYRAQLWAEAQARFEELAREAPQARIPAIYLERIAFLRQNAPGNGWTGAWRFKTK